MSEELETMSSVSGQQLEEVCEQDKDKIVGASPTILSASSGCCFPDILMQIKEFCS